MTTKTPNTKEVTSGRELLIEWANQQEHWLRGIVSEVLDSQVALADEQIEYFYKLLLVEKELEVGTKTSIPQLVDSGTADSAEQALTLAQIKDIVNVNCLASGQELSFNKRLTVIFGENAAGKSGYARILKGLAAVRTAESILSDISKPQEKPCATVGYWLGSEDFDPSKATMIKWSGEHGIAPLTRIDVFDSRGVDVHVDGELAYVYTPADIALFPLIADAIDRVKAMLEKARMQITNEENSFASRFSSNGVIRTKVGALSSKTDIAELKQLAMITPEEEVSLVDLEARVDALRSDTTDAPLQLAQSDKLFLSSVIKSADSLLKFNANSYNAALQALATARETYKSTSELAFADEAIPGFSSAQWNAFIEAGENYISEIHAEYPQKEDSCIYCRQSLSESAVALIRKYRNYCSNEAKKNVISAEAALNTIVLVLDDAAAERSMRGWEGKESEGKSKDAWKEKVEVAAKEVLDLQGRVKQRMQLSASISDDWKTIGEEAKARLDAIEKNISEFQSHGMERKKAFEDELGKLLLLKDRIQLRECIAGIVGFVERAKWADAVNVVVSKFRGTSSSLTELSKLASEHLLNQDFGKLFLQECEALKAPTVTLDFSGKKGLAARKKILVKGHKLSDILSEGEQKVIALADFIAETSLRRKSSPVVFDDPVNSLDYKRLKHVVSRVVELSKTRQVIVFTHNIWLATELLDCFTRNKKGCTYYDIRSEEGRRGLLSQANNPRLDVFDNYKSQVEALIKQIEKQTDPVIKESLVRSAYDAMRGACEIFVETDLFQDVTRRYRANIMMTKLGEIKPERLPPAIKVVEDVFAKCCDVMWGHSHTAETASIRPSFDELKSEWSQLKSARDTYLAKE